MKKSKYKESVIKELCDFKHLGVCVGVCGIYKRYNPITKELQEITNACNTHKLVATGLTPTIYEYPFECQNERN